MKNYQFSIRLTIPFSKVKSFGGATRGDIAKQTFIEYAKNHIAFILPVRQTVDKNPKDFTFESNFVLVEREELREFMLDFLSDKIDEQAFKDLIFDVKAKRALKNIKA